MYRSPWATRLTVFGERDPDNHKPFRRRTQKMAARERAQKDEDGTYRTDVGAGLHPTSQFKMTKHHKRHAYNYFMACGDEARARAALHND